MHELEGLAIETPDEDQHQNSYQVEEVDQGAAPGEPQQLVPRAGGKRQHRRGKDDDLIDSGALLDDLHGKSRVGDNPTRHTDVVTQQTQERVLDLGGTDDRRLHQRGKLLLQVRVGDRLDAEVHDEKTDETIGRIRGSAPERGPKSRRATCRVAQVFALAIFLDGIPRHARVYSYPGDPVEPDALA